MRFNPYSLRFKLMLASTLVEALMLGLLLLNTVRLIDEAMLASTEAALRQTVPMLNVSTAPYVVQGDYATLQDNLNEMLGDVDQGVVYIVVRDASGRVVAKAGTADPRALPPPSNDLKDALSGAVLHVERPLSLAGQQVGTLRFGLSTRIIALAKINLLKQSGSIAVAEILVSFVLLSVLGYWLTRNLWKFVEGSRAIADGRYDLKLQQTGRDEVAELARNFNHMGEAIENKIGELHASERKYRELNEQLETRVEQRTQELQQAMAQIVESEKLASLGRIVAGVAHELNTPIGNIVLTSSAAGENLKRLTEVVQSKNVSRSVLVQAVQELDNANRLVARSAQRAAELIESFKRVAVDQSSMRRRVFDLHQIIEDIVHTLGTILRHAKVAVEIAIPDGIEMDSYPAHLEQIFNNLILNSIKHGFEGRDGGHITISARRMENDIEIVYRDDGCGIAPDLHRKVFEPFYTSKLAQGGSGLGMFIVHNLTYGALKGKLDLDSDVGQGLKITLHFPSVTE
ncbi:MAG TPA: HAMP domain-containing sensor histidine kinase [Paucimonas sp.]|nr:HAMP domain-containing sensor histidine kinase [Paucimonas sp.]